MSKVDDTAGAMTMMVMMGGGDELVSHFESGVQLLDSMISGMEEEGKTEISLEKLKEQKDAMTGMVDSLKELTEEVNKLKEDKVSTGSDDLDAVLSFLGGK